MKEYFVYFLLIAALATSYVMYTKRKMVNVVCLDPRLNVNIGAQLGEYTASYVSYVYGITWQSRRLCLEFLASNITGPLMVYGMSNNAMAMHAARSLSGTNVMWLCHKGEVYDLTNTTPMLPMLRSERQIVDDNKSGVRMLRIHVGNMPMPTITYDEDYVPVGVVLFYPIFDAKPDNIARMKVDIEHGLKNAPDREVTIVTFDGHMEPIAYVLGMVLSNAALVLCRDGTKRLVIT